MHYLHAIPARCMYAACINCMDMKDLHMKELRERLHMTQAQFAEALGLSTRTVATYEAGAEPPKHIRMACRWLEHEATANAPAPGDDGLPDEQPADHGAPAWRASVEERLEAQSARTTKLYQDAAKAFGELGQRLQMLELRAGKIAPTMTESDIGMIARRAARSVLPD